MLPARRASGKWEWDLKHGMKLHMKCTRTSPGYSATWEMSAQQDLAPLKPPSHPQEEAAHKKMRRPSLLQEVDLGLTVCLVRIPVPLKPTKHQKTAQKAEKQLCECRENS